MPKSYGSDSKGGGKGPGQATSDGRQSSKIDWRPETGSPEPPGEAAKIPRPE